MLLKQLLQSPGTSSKMLVYDPFADVDRFDLVREVIGLANADVEGPRHILFGVNAAAVEGDGIVGISESTAAGLKKAHRLVSMLVEPTLELAFIYDRINGKLVGALEIDGCDFGPYFVGDDLSASMQRGQCWVRDGRELRAMERGSAPHMPECESEASGSKLPEHVDFSVGFGDDPDRDFIELSIPDASSPPFAEELGDAEESMVITQVLKQTVRTRTTQILRLGQGNVAMMLAESADGEDTGLSEHAGKILADARNHYFFEERAVRIAMCIRNRGDEDLKNVTMEFGFPRIPDFDVADRLYVSPFDKRSDGEIRNMGYPAVEYRDDAIYVRSPIEMLPAGGTCQALNCPLRLAVKPAMHGRKLAIDYTLRGPGDENLGGGRLKIRFGAVTS